MTVDIGIVSTAHLHADAYAPALRPLDDARLVGVADEDPERGADFAERHETTYYPADELLERVDGVVVCSTNADHLGWAERAADHGVHVLSEKPLGTTAREAQSIVETCASAGVHLGVAMPLRFSRPALTAARALERGKLGEVQALIGTNRGKMPGGWFADFDAAGGGAAMDHTVHIVDLVHWLTGERVEEVHAETGTRFHDIPVEDVNVISMKLTDATLFTLDGSWSKPDSWDFWGDATLRLIGTDTTLDVDCFDQTYKLTTERDPSGISTVYWGSDPNADLIADFVQAIAADRPPEITGPEGVDAVRVVDAVYESADVGGPVTVSQ